jgi:sulfite exporter TauE/SafE
MNAAWAMTWAGGALFPVAVGLGSSFTHCAGMCGPIHLFLASSKRASGGTSGNRVWFYHAGRVLGYAALGVFAGVFGNWLLGWESAPVKAAAGWGLAALYAFFGWQMLGGVPAAWRLETWLSPLFPSRIFGRWAAGEGASKATVLFPAGLMASLLPCPSTHAVLLFGIGLPHPAWSGAAMATLGISTLPVFLLLPKRGPGDGSRLGRHYGKILGLAFLGLAGWRIYAAVGAGTPACH